MFVWHTNFRKTIRTVKTAELLSIHVHVSINESGLSNIR
jgi:hypothetical protein